LLGSIYIAGGENIEQIQVEMRAFGLKLDNPMKLKIVTSEQWYTPDGEFHADRVVKQFRRLIDESVDRGFKGLYVSADVADTFDYLSKNLTPWLKYENSLGRIFRFPMEAICAYRINQIINSQALPQLLQGHKNTITPKNAEIVDNKKLYMDAATEEFNNILGEEATKIIFHYLEVTSKLAIDQIPDKVEEFNEMLQSILGRVTLLINQTILKNLYGKIELH